MSSSPLNPKMLKGAFLTYNPQSEQLTDVIKFQYNPSTMTRTLQPQYIGGDQTDRVDAVRFQGAPVQTISLKLEIDAVDLLAASDPTAVADGIQPQLASLELLTYPSTSQVQSENQELESGAIEIVPPLAPITVFAWGANRIVPVRVDRINTVEEIYDLDLNPIRAVMEVTLRVLSYSDLVMSNPAYQVFVNYQKGLENLAGKVATEDTTGVLQGSSGTTLSSL